MNKAPIFAIDRLRMGTDGVGITTLVCFAGCPLKCKYCINRHCHLPIYQNDGQTPRQGTMLLTPQELYEKVKIDNIYFQSTGGGITFGGGEPTLYAQFIEEFRAVCGNKWKLNIETSAYCSHDTLRSLSYVVDHWFVDIKSMNAQVYEAYTEQPSQVMDSLRWLQSLVPPERVTIRIPTIPHYNEDADIEQEMALIRSFGFTNIDHFTYEITKR